MLEHRSKSTQNDGHLLVGQPLVPLRTVCQ